jgi:hypothetical protein
MQLELGESLRRRRNLWCLDSGDSTTTHNINNSGSGESKFSYPIFLWRIMAHNKELVWILVWISFGTLFYTFDQGNWLGPIWLRKRCFPGSE